ncbi:thioredoxin family protein [Siphonobacter curvatus]|uniref:Thioredoxin n=1 Tax=Siphonobacter curvatus TaxID=2094562 RepID=A0A2S7IKI2_9BACT|nr:DUF255 domain-containing protein [Siphonobacter curvatus]PQA58217.1 thioredoxin [Siphonobacter curvatus]
MKTLRLVVVLLLTGLTFQTNASDEPKKEGIQFFHGTWKQALAKAKAENKMIFLDAYTTWCGPCKWMQTKSFPNKLVGDLYNSKFINVKLDMEAGEGLKLIDRYPVEGFPTLFFIDYEGEVVLKEAGAKTPEQLIAFANEAIEQ